MWIVEFCSSSLTVVGRRFDGCIAKQSLGLQTQALAETPLSNLPKPQQEITQLSEALLALLLFSVYLGV
jgi:hypothetical protein